MDEMAKKNEGFLINTGSLLEIIPPYVFNDGSENIAACKIEMAKMKYK